MQNLGVFTGSRTFQGAVTNSQSIDYTFELRHRASIAIALTGLSDSADIKLRSSNNEVFGQSGNGGTMADTISQRLDPGTYTLQVSTFKPNVTYALSIQTQLDLHSDLIWRNSSTDQIAVWRLNETEFKSGKIQTAFPKVAADWQMLGMADFNSDGEADYLWRNHKTDETAIWYLKNGAFGSGEFLENAPKLGSNSDWQIVATADFDRDNQADLLWRNHKTDETGFWYIKNGKFASGAMLQNSPKIGGDSDWKIVAVADFDRDQHIDFLWRNHKTDETGYWSIKNGGFAFGKMLENAPNIGGNSDWKIQGASDFDRDGEADLLWQNPQSGEIGVWLLKQGKFEQGKLLGNDPRVRDRAWQIVGIEQADEPIITIGGQSLETAFALSRLHTEFDSGLDQYVGIGNYTDSLESGKSAFYQFQFDAESFFGEVNLLQLTGNATLEILDDRGSPVSTSGFREGTYYAKVTNSAHTPARYQLNLVNKPLNFEKLGTGEKIQRFSTPENDYGEGVTIDPFGDVCVTGSSIHAYSGRSLDDDAFIAKYDKKGNQLWAKHFGTANDDYARKIASDSSGNLYVVGWTLNKSTKNGNVFLAKYAANGTQQWFKEFGSKNTDFGLDIAIDRNDNIYLSGAFGDGTLDSLKQWNAFIAKYDGNGEQQWLKVLDEAGMAISLATDNSGSIYLAGASKTSTRSDRDFFIAKYDTLGTQQWFKQFGTTGDDDVSNIAIDERGDLYVAGMTNRNDSAFLMRFDHGGNQQWTKEFWVGNFGSISIATAASEVFVTGFRTVQIDMNQNRRGVYLMLVNSVGEVSTSEQIIDESRAATVNDIAIDREGRVYITGDTYVGFERGNRGGTDAFIYGATFTL